MSLCRWVGPSFCPSVQGHCFLDLFDVLGSNNVEHTAWFFFQILRQCAEMLKFVEANRKDKKVMDSLGEMIYFFFRNGCLDTYHCAGANLHNRGPLYCFSKVSWAWGSQCEPQFLMRIRRLNFKGITSKWIRLQTSGCYQFAADEPSSAVILIIKEMIQSIKM